MRYPGALNLIKSTSFLPSLAGLLIALCSASAFSQNVSSDCGSLENHYGPIDYRTNPKNLALVVDAHFTPIVEALIRGSTTLRPGGDIDYTLRAIPNNHRALIAMMRLGEKEKTSQPNGSKYTFECWFIRATVFRPDDTVVRMIYANYLYKIGRIPDANTQLELATSYSKDNGLTYYNVGLHYFDFKNYDKALLNAHKALALGWTHGDLRDQLIRVGKWREPKTKKLSIVPVNNE